MRKPIILISILLVIALVMCHGASADVPVMPDPAELGYPVTFDQNQDSSFCFQRSYRAENMDDVQDIVMVYMETLLQFSELKYIQCAFGDNGWIYHVFAAAEDHSLSSFCCWLNGNESTTDEGCVVISYHPDFSDIYFFVSPDLTLWDYSAPVQPTEAPTPVPTPTPKSTPKPTARVIPKTTIQPSSGVTTKPTENTSLLPGSSSSKTLCYQCGGVGSYDKNCSHCSGRGRQNCLSCDGAKTRTCGGCSGAKTFRCGACDGDGMKRCSYCGGKGIRSNGKDCSVCTAGQKRCDTCSGKGRKNCSVCNGQGTRTCDFCSGRGNYDCAYCTGGKESVFCTLCGGDGWR